MEFPVYIGEDVVDPEAFLRKHSSIRGLKKHPQKHPNFFSFYDGFIFFEKSKVNGIVLYFSPEYEIFSNKRGRAMVDNILKEKDFSLVSSENGRNLYRSGDIFYDITFLNGNKVDRIYMYVK